jgi:hypothetical protein
MQVAFIIPLNLPVILAATLYQTNWFYPAFMIVVGTHYLPFMTLYGMRIYAVLAALLIGGGVAIAMTSLSASFTLGAWLTGAVLLIFAAIIQVTNVKKPSLSV